MTVSFALAVWQPLLLISAALIGCLFIPVPNDAYGVGALIRGVGLLFAILLIWLVYFAGRFMLG